jgi:ABC-type nitrate/sulfonate/bicarbonate transport system permease component
MRLGLGVAITGILLAETVVARAGLGSQAVNYYAQLRIAEMYALLLLIFVGALLINAMVSRVIRKATHYQNNNEQNINM